MAERIRAKSHAPTIAPPEESGQRPGRLGVVLDAGPAVHQSAGLARYTESLASALWQHCRDEIDLSLFYNRHSDHQPPVSLATIPARALPMRQHPWRLGVLACQLLRAPYVERKLATGDIYHATEHLLPWMARPSVMTVHDLIFERFPQHHTLANRAFLRVAMPLFVRRADAIIAVSRHTKQDILDLYGTPPQKVTVVDEGIEDHFEPADEEEIRRVQDQYGIRRQYLLMVGTLEPRKNHALAFEALARLKAEGWPHCLVVAGGRGWLFDTVKSEVELLGLADDVIFTGRVPEKDLPPLYSGAGCFLMPSLYEGFGIPVLEAMACAAPVVCSRASSLPEVAGDAALYIESLAADALAAQVREVLSNPETARQMRDDGLRQAARFCWRSAALETAEVYKAVVGGSH